MSPARAHALLHVTVFVWGFTAILGKLISLNAAALVWYRQLFAAGALLAWLGVRRKLRALAWADVARLAGIGALVCLHWFTFYASIRVTGVAVAVVCLSATSLFVSVLEPLLFRRPLRAPEVLLGAAVIAGVVLLTKSQARADGMGVALGLASAFCSALFGTLNGKLTQRLDAAHMTLWELSAATLWLSAALLVVPEYWVPPSALTPSDTGWLLVLAIGCTVLPWQWSLSVLRTVSPFTVALAVNLEPVYSMALAYVLFPAEERLGAAFYAGAGVIVALVLGHGLLRSRPSVKGVAASAS